ncbi:MAG TPA: LacI family DNA-binding transcriptional regulator [Motilibacterales bacterium]|nr:LacI family DNA-binding transcriptional regulator [Motilibacterales bacterium]
MAIGPSRAPAMTDVARLAGVSHQTVSRVLNDHPNVKQQTRLRVLAAMQELGYRPNRAARALASGRSDQIGVVAQPSTLFGPASLLYAVEAAAVQAGYGVSVASVAALDRASIEEAVNRHLDQQVGGIIVIVPVVSAAAAIREVPADQPLVTIGGDRNEAITSVGIDQVRGATQATQALLEAGHRTVWHVSGPVDVFDSLDRIDGWRATLEQAGAEVPPVITSDWSAAGGYEAGKMLARIPDVTAIFAANDQTALGILRALHEHGLRVPEDVSLIGFDDLPESEFFIPPLTTVRQAFQEVGQRALRMLVTQMEGQREVLHELVPPVFIRRESVAPPRDRRDTGVPA